MLLAVMRAILLCCALALAACRTPAPPVATPAPTGEAVSGTVVILPDHGRATVLRHIGSARSNIDVYAYLLADRSTAEALSAAVLRGVNVRIILERKPFGGDNAQAFARLRNLGMTVRESSPAFRFSHAKVMVIDQRVALIGTANYTRSSYERNREFIAVVEDQGVVATLDKLFAADWDNEAPPPIHPALIVSPENSRRQLTNLVDQAVESLMIYESDTGDQRFTDAIVRAAKRGVEVRYITNPDRSPVGDRDDRLLAKLKEAGGRVGYLQAPFVHAKVVLADNRLVAIGSVNSTPTSFDQNREIGILLNNPEAIDAVRSTFEHDWVLTQ